MVWEEGMMRVGVQCRANNILIAALLFLATDLFAANTDPKELFKCNKVLPQSALTHSSKIKEIDEYDGSVGYATYSKTVNTKNKCFKIIASELIYLIDRDQAIYKVFTEDYVNPWIMVDFNKAKAPHGEFKGIVKGVGKYTYKGDKGIPYSIPYMIVIR